MEAAAAAVHSALTALRGARHPGRPLSDEQLLADAEAWEILGRLVDARRVAAAAEVEWRSRPSLSGDGLASRLEVRDGA
ncbi:MAG: hypothetical protein QOC59_1505, partial [Microbacteriaceae bacterium]|nr:hypothetical protein [Microbacteriaceae bacterium]